MLVFAGFAGLREKKNHSKPVRGNEGFLTERTELHRERALFKYAPVQLSSGADEPAHLTLRSIAGRLDLLSLLINHATDRSKNVLCISNQPRPMKSTPLPVHCS